MQVQFTAVFQKVPEGYVAFVEEIPGANTQGATLEEARDNLEETVLLVLEANRLVAEEELNGADVIREPLPLTTSALSTIARRLLEKQLFQLATSYKPLLKWGIIDERLRKVFLSHGHALVMGGGSVTSVAQGKWRITNGDISYLIRDIGDALLVSVEKHPEISNIVSLISSSYDYLRHSFWYALRNELFFISATIHKRLLDKPDKLMVNIGAGIWYEKNWKTLDYSCEWYRYKSMFIDYKHDLTSGKSLPFNDSSVHLLYSEHVFEHISDECCQYLFREIYRALVAGGGFRVVVPDADLIYNKFLQKDQEFFKEWMSVKNATLSEMFLILFAHPRVPVDEPKLEADLKTLSKEEFFNMYTRPLRYEYKRAGEHINWFSYDKLERMLKKAGFDAIYLSRAQESRFSEIRGKKFDTRPSWSVHVDAVK